MKKLFFTLALALGLAASVSAQQTGLFGYGPAKGGYENYSTDYETRESVFNLPNQHGSSDDVSAPLGMGTAILLSLGAAYLANKKRKNQKSYNTRFFLMAAVMTAGMISANNVAVGQVVSGTTYSTLPSNLPTNWSGSQHTNNNNSYYSLTYSTDFIQTSEFNQYGFSSITIKARMYGGPDANAKVITVSWYDSSTKSETVLGTVSPTNTTLKNYSISSPSNPSSGTGYVKIQCKQADSNKGCGVSEVTITYTSSSAPSLSISPTTKSVPCTSSSPEFTITPSNIASPSYSLQFYTAATEGNAIEKPNWIGTPTFEGNTLTLPVSANTGNERYAFFTVKSGDVESTDRVSLTQAVYTPTAPELPSSANFDYTMEVSITPASGTTVYYTTDGTAPSSSSTQYVAPFEINATTTVKAIAYDGNYASSVVSATYTRTYKYINQITATGSYKVIGTVVAKNSKGLVIGDGTGYVYYYKSSAPTQNVGDKISISGSISTSDKIYRYTGSPTMATVTTSNYTSDTPTVIDGDDMYTVSQSSSNYLSKYEQFTGYLTKSSNNYDIAVNGDDHNVTARISSPNNTSTLDNYTGKKVRINGYFTGYSSSRYFVMLESIEGLPTLTASTTSLSGFNYYYGSGPSTSQTFTINGYFLTNDIVVALSDASCFEISESENSGYTNQITISKGNGTVTNKTIYVRLKADLESGTYNTSKISVSSVEADPVNDITLNGTVKYAIDIDGTITNGTVTTAPSGGAFEGDEITITANPSDNNHKLKNLTVYKTGDNTTTVSINTDNKFTMPAYGVTVTATFPPVYSVTYNSNGGTGTMTDNNKYFEEDEVSLLGNTFKKTGYSWSSWTAKDASDIELTIDNGKIAMPASAVTVTANWTINKHNVTMPANDTYGTYQASATSEVEYNTEVTLTYTPAEGYENYVAVWSVNDAAITGNKFNMPDADVSITVAPHATYTVTYNANGGEGTVTDATVYDVNAIVTAKPNSFTYAGHTFTGWNTKADGTGTAIAAGGTFTITGYTTLYAQWFEGYIYDFSSSQNFYTTSGGSTHPSGNTETFYYGNGHEFTASGSDNYKFNSGYYALGKASAKLNLPTFDGYYITKVVLLSSGGHSKSVTVSITTMDGETEKTVSNAQLWGETNTEYSYDIYVPYQDHPLSVTVTNAFNTQFKTLTLYLEPKTADPSVVVSPASQTVNHTAQTIASGKPLGFGVFSRNIQSPTFLLAYCNENGEVLGSNPYDWFEASCTADSITYSVQAQAEDGVDRTAFFKAYTMVNSEPVYSKLISVMQKHYPATYTLITSTNDLVPGRHYIIASGTSGSVYVMGQQGDNNRAAVADNEVSSSNQIVENTGIQEVVISGYADNWTIYDEAYEGYLYAAGSGSGKNYLRTQSPNDDNGKWAITFSNDKAQIVAQGTNSNKTIYFNNSAKVFSCYSNAQQDIFLYKRTTTDDNYNFYSNTTLSSATIANGETYTVHSPAVLNISTLTNNGNLVIEDGAQLITSSTDVQATVKKNITAASQWGAGNYTPDHWYFIASPICTNFQVSGLHTTGTGHDYDLYYLGEETMKWYNHKNGEHQNFNIAQKQGYLYGSEGGTIIQFTGTIQPDVTAGIEVGITKLGEGFNLVGNPFPFDAYVNVSYYTLDENGETVSSTPVSKSTAIKPCTGIVVKAEGTENEKVTFRKTAFTDGSANNGNLQVNLSQQVITRGETTSTKLDNAIVSFNEGDQLEKFYFGTQNANIYIPQNHEEYAIAYSDMQGEKPVNFVAAEDGQYTITVNAEDVEMSYLHLIDNLTGADVDLLATPSYTFNAKWDDYASRFRLVFSANNTNNIEEGDDDFAFISNGQIIINGNTNNATLQTVDMLGRMVNTQQVNGNTAQMAPVANGVYVLRLIDGTNVKSQKIVVR